MIVGIESRIVLCDIAGLDDDESEHVKQWAAAALVDAALRESSTHAGTGGHGTTVAETVSV